jgi:hypothetical protein
MIRTALLYLLMIVPCIELIFASAQQTPSLHVQVTCDVSNDQNQADGNAECLGTDAFGDAACKRKQPGVCTWSTRGT